MRNLLLRYSLLPAVLLLAFLMPYSASAQLPTTGEVTLFEHKNYGGTYQKLSLGSSSSRTFSYSSFKNVGNDEISSIRVGPGVKLTVYFDDDYDGRCVIYYSGAYGKLPCGLNDEISSIKIEKTNYYNRVWLCVDATGLSSPYQALGIGEYTNSTGLLCNDEFSAIHVPSGIRVTIYENADGSGKRKTFESSGWISLKDHDMNDKVSKVSIRRAN